MMGYIQDLGLVLDLPFYKLNGASIKSQDAYGHLCSVTGAVWQPSGRYFDGTDDFISVPAHLTNNPSLVLQECTLEVWLKKAADDTEYGVLAKGRIGSTTNPYELAVEADNTVSLELRIGGSIRHVTGSSIDTGWHHIVGTHEDPLLKIYVDAGTPGELSYAGDVDGYDQNTDVRIGYRWKTSNNWSHPFNGLIGEVRFYNRALTAQEIQNNYLATKWRYR